MSQDPLRHALTTQRPLLLGWVSTGVPVVVELLGEAGYGAVLIDQQHSVASHSDLVNCLTAARAARLPGLVRPLTPDAGLIGAALDAGAQGVVVPLIETVSDAEACVRAVKYTPQGMRSWGPYRGRLMTGGDYAKEANDWTIACVQIETRGAMDNLDDILRIDGLDMVLVGPNDLAMALTGSRDIRAPEMTEACDLILKKARERSVFTAIFANDLDYARPFAEAGWNAIAVGTDMGLISGAAANIVKTLKNA